MQKINLAEAFAAFDDCWNPRIAGAINDTLVKVVKLSGAFDWHHHESEDEMFLVIAGRLRIRLRDGDVDLDPGEFLIVPRGVEHCPEALVEPCHVLLVEPGTTLNTGTLVTERTRHTLERLD
jgi:mannose-6-phosphate isomerase-like protein (cupin superfamily)